MTALLARHEQTLTEAFEQPEDDDVWAEDQAALDEHQHRFAALKDILNAAALGTA